MIRKKLSNILNRTLQAQTETPYHAMQLLLLVVRRPHRGQRSKRQVF